MPRAAVPCVRRWRDDAQPSRRSRSRRRTFPPPANLDVTRRQGQAAKAGRCRPLLIASHRITRSGKRRSACRSRNADISYVGPPNPGATAVERCRHYRVFLAGTKASTRVRHANDGRGAWRGNARKLSDARTAVDDFEIDPEVEWIARTDAYFTYLRWRGDGCHVVRGGARGLQRVNARPGVAPDRGGAGIGRSFRKPS